MFLFALGCEYNMASPYGRNFFLKICHVVKLYAANPIFPFDSHVINGTEILRPTNKQATCYMLHAGLLRSLFFDPEDGGEMFLRKIP
jgi:hypothetical protein